MVALPVLQLWNRPLSPPRATGGPETGAAFRTPNRPPKRCPPTVGGHGSGGLKQCREMEPVLGPIYGHLLNKHAPLSHNPTRPHIPRTCTAIQESTRHLCRPVHMPARLLARASSMQCDLLCVCCVWCLVGFVWCVLCMSCLFSVRGVRGACSP